MSFTLSCSRCTKYPSLPAGCTLVADPSDPLCCKIPQCAPNPNSNSSQPYPTPPPGHVTGGSVTPAPSPINTPAPQPGVSTQRPPINPTPAPTRNYSLCILTFNPFPNNKYKTLLNRKGLQTTSLNLMFKHGRNFSKRKENTVRKREIAHYEQFLLFLQFFFFKKLVLQTFKNHGLFWKGLNLPKLVSTLSQ